MTGKVTRRSLARSLAAALPAAAASSQQPPDADAELKAARERVAANAKRLAAKSLPMAVEPSFTFKA